MAWPRKRQEAALVFVDFMNVYLSRREAFQGPCEEVREILRSCREVGLSLAHDPLVLIYLDLEIFANRNQDIWPEFMQACEEFDLYIFDVASDAWGRDQVDPVIIEDMLRSNQATSADMPFVLVTADKGFSQVVLEVRQHREVYIVLPVIGMISSLTRAGDGWQWLHPVGDVSMAMADLLIDYDRFRRSSLYIRARLHLVYILGRLRPGKYLNGWHYLAPRACDRDTRNWMTDEELCLYTEVLLYYGILSRDGDRLLVQDHPLVGQWFLQSSEYAKPAFQR